MTTESIYAADRNPTFLRAVDIIGGYTRLAECLGTTKANVWNWGSTKRRVPAEYCPAIEKLTDGAVRCEELRPDIPWGILREQAGEAATA